MRTRSEHSPEGKSIKDEKQRFSWLENYMRGISQQSIPPGREKTGAWANPQSLTQADDFL